MRECYTTSMIIVWSCKKKSFEWKLMLTIVCVYSQFISVQGSNLYKSDTLCNVTPNCQSRKMQNFLQFVAPFSRCRHKAQRKEILLNLSSYSTCIDRREKENTPEVVWSRFWTLDRTPIHSSPGSPTCQDRERNLLKLTVAWKQL